MSGPAVAVTGLGLVTAAGVGVQDTWKRVCEGRSTASRDPSLKGMPVDISCSVPAYDTNELLGRRSALKYDRFVQLALIAAIEAVADSGLDPDSWDGARVGVVLGCGMGGLGSYDEQHRRMSESGPENVSPMLIPLMIPNMAAGHVGMRFGARGPNFVTATACASGATAIGAALDLLRRGECDVVITGGTEAGIVPLVVTGFARMGALSTRRLDDPASASRPFDADRDGFVIGEGAGILVLERAEHARARGARVRAHLAGYGASADAHHATAPDPEGRGVALAVTAALADAGVAAGEVDHVNAHGTSTPLNDAAEAASIRRLLGDRPVVTSTKGVVGHTLGAAGAIEAALTVLAIQERTVPPTANLTERDAGVEIDIVRDQPRTHHSRVAMSNSFGFGGQNAVLVFTEGA
ncbi:3-oxoacyl-[acyl-carrier-protein] synthase II [Nocardiopsis sp. Huas11]|uniref:beta-ketoacyl-ACP synthase II n=1 Tax=Nocardiopsis sp. Huas11 TaxID=2183912 RepID=UPI000EADF77F|nr:beta-ketoacyl-ACP synthase II [Nocardiopsis sp. Huas11]RKS09674.1 3-oxoacyl-[acyl-carrier-protein] synthase II [Nocardiopsis sp. Huas11]